MESIVDKLSLDILVTIFSFLQLDDRIRFSRTCKWFYAAAYHIEDLDFSDVRSIVAMRKMPKTANVLQKLITYRLRRLTVRKNINISLLADDAELDVRGVRYAFIENTKFFDLTNTCEKFVTLTTLYTGMIPMSVLTYLLESCKNLRFIKASVDYWLLDVSFSEKIKFFAREEPLSTSLKSLLVDTNTFNEYEQLLLLCPNVDEMMLYEWIPGKSPATARPIRVFILTFGPSIHYNLFFLGGGGVSTIGIACYLKLPLH